MRQIIFAFLIATALISASAYSQSIDDLLKQADNILQNKSTPSEKSDKTSEKKTVKRKKIKNPDDEDEFDDSAPESAKPSQPTLTKLIEETQPADLKGVVELDAKAAQQSAERQKRALASVAILLGVNQMKEGYGFEKNEDNFSSEESTIRGATLEVESSPMTVGPKDLDLSLRFGASLGYYRGDVDVVRTGVFNEKKNYPYTMVPGNGFARFAWQPLSWLEPSVHGGLAMELVQQAGAEDTDTSSMVCFGPVVGAQLRWIIQERVSIFGVAERKGFSAKASQNTIAGNHYAFGTSFNLFL